MKVTITNKFHNQSCTIRVPGFGAALSAAQVRKIKSLCRYSDCCCGDFLEAYVDGRKADLEADYDIGGLQMTYRVREYER